VALLGPALPLLLLLACVPRPAAAAGRGTTATTVAGPVLGWRLEEAGLLAAAAAAPLLPLL
jgi:hypothetical protein